MSSRLFRCGRLGRRWAGPETAVCRGRAASSTPSGRSEPDRQRRPFCHVWETPPDGWLRSAISSLRQATAIISCREPAYILDVPQDYMFRRLKGLSPPGPMHARLEIVAPGRQILHRRTTCTLAARLGRPGGQVLPPVPVRVKTRRRLLSRVSWPTMPATGAYLRICRSHRIMSGYNGCAPPAVSAVRARTIRRILKPNYSRTILT